MVFCIPTQVSEVWEEDIFSLYNNIIININILTFDQILGDISLET